jgi:hypothetical protein
LVKENHSLGAKRLRLMKRRQVITFLASVAAWPLGPQAQQPARMPIIAFFSAGSAAAMRDRTSALSDRLCELGWIEDRTTRN